MKIYIVGEDQVTYAVLRKVISYCSSRFEIISELPARGGQIKNKIPEFNKLAAVFPVILLMDLDAEFCAPVLMGKLIPEYKQAQFLVNIAVDEAEAWLMADREGFSDYFGILIEDMPVSYQTKQNGKNSVIEMKFSCKSSWYLTNELMKKSKKNGLIGQLTPKSGATKGPEYNSAMIPFINNIWSVENACKHSDSLQRMVRRIKTLHASS